MSDTRLRNKILAVAAEWDGTVQVSDIVSEKSDRYARFGKSRAARIARVRSVLSDMEHEGILLRVSADEWKVAD